MQRVMQTYDYTTDVSELKDARRMKIVYCTYLMEDAGTAAKLFGLELQDMVWENRTFDVENDFHGMYYLYGIIGLALFLLFLLYFAELIVRALLRQFSTVHDAGGREPLAFLCACCSCTCTVRRAFCADPMRRSIFRLCWRSFTI